MPDMSDLQNEARLRILEPARELLADRAKLKVVSVVSGSDAPYLLLVTLSEQSVGAVARSLHRYFPGRYVLEVLRCEDRIEDHPPAIDLAIRCKELSA